MASVTLDSEAAFKERALKIGLSQDNVDALNVAGFRTFGAVAFAVSATPNAASEDEVKQWIRTVFGALLSPHQLACMRRLHFEAQSLSISDMKSRVEPSVDAAAKKMPVAERLARQKAQESRLPGVILLPETMPAHEVVDKLWLKCWSKGS